VKLLYSHRSKLHPANRTHLGRPANVGKDVGEPRY